MANKKVWYAKDATLMVDTVVATVDTAKTLYENISATGTWTSRIKDVKVSPPERDVDAINVLGYQQLKSEGRPTMATCTFNTVYYPQGAVTNTTLKDFLFGLGTAGTGTAVGYNRYRGGEKSTNDRTEMACLITYSRPGAAVIDTSMVLFNNATVTSGPISLNSDGEVEQEFTIKCLAPDYYEDTGAIADPAT
uniref:Tail protein n=1 Tax=viral metagenome TaxID=1070528 RepID=A0A6M3IJP6_9ZZZZ